MSSDAEIDAILKAAEQALSQVDSLPALQQLKAAYLGKKGQLSALLKSLGKLPPEQRRDFGQAVNAAKNTLETWIHERHEALTAQEIEQRLAKEQVDVTLPGRLSQAGGLHPVTKTINRMLSILSQMGFSVAQGPEIETDYYNFEALNFPPKHPARAMQDTFYLPGGHVLRTHTSSVQIRAMEKSDPPLRLIAPGRVYRCDSDVTHTPMFHQIEGLWVDESVTFAALKDFLANFIQAFFDKDLNVRFRPSFFPFTEPSAEMDISCTHCDGQGCRICSHTGWLEVLGCGMVHPNVLQATNIDPERYQGFAFGIGIDRMTMLRYRITDLRSLFENDIRFLNAFTSADE